MQFSRQVVKTEKPRRFTKQAEEEMRDKQKKKQQLKKLADIKGYDMWGDHDHGY